MSSLTNWRSRSQEATTWLLASKFLHHFRLRGQALLLPQLHCCCPSHVVPTPTKQVKTWGPTATDPRICWSSSTPCSVTVSLAFSRAQDETSPWWKLNCIWSIRARGLRSLDVCYDVQWFWWGTEHRKGMKVDPGSRTDILLSLSILGFWNWSFH